MKWLIGYIRQCFCKHDFELLSETRLFIKDGKLPYEIRRTYRCKKCGYAKRYKL